MADDKRHYGEPFSFDEYITMMKEGKTRTQYPIEMIVAMSKCADKRRDAGISATTLLDCPRKFILSREEEFYEFPADYWARFRGSLAHLLMEAHDEGDSQIIREHRIKKVINVDGVDVEITGQSDKVDPRQKLIIDYKSTKSINRKPINEGKPKPDHPKQVSIYRWLWRGGTCIERDSPHFAYGETVNVEINRGGIAYFDMQGCRKITVDLMSLEETEEFIRSRLRPLVQYETDKELPGLLRDENGRRSRLCDWCSVRQACDARGS